MRGLGGSERIFKKKCVLSAIGLLFPPLLPLSKSPCLYLIEVGKGGDPHRFEVHEKGAITSHSARWLVDAGGRPGILARQLDLRVSEDSHQVGSVWGRFEGVADVDAATRHRRAGRYS